MKSNIDFELYSDIDTCRIDIKNSREAQNSVKLLHSSDENIVSKYPKWFKDDTGSGMVITSNEHFLDLSIKCINNGTLSIYLRSPDIRDKNKVKLQYYINYNSFKINNVDQITQDKLASHDDYFLVERRVRDGEIINIHLEWAIASFKLELKEILGFVNDLNYLKSENEKKNEIINSYNQLFNSLFLNFDLKPLPLLGNIKDGCVELLKFVDNVCKKYELTWWLDYGALLGAVRHEGFIPWDDDIDIGMPRKDGEKLFSVIQTEIKNNNLDDKITAEFRTSTHTGGVTVGHSIVYRRTNGRGGFIAAVDVFLYDFVPDLTNFRENYWKERKNFYDKIKSGYDLNKARDESVSHLKVKSEIDKYMTVGIDGAALKIYESKEVFPLSQISYEGNMFPCPKNYRYYLKTLYGNDYLHVPQLVSIHDRTRWFRTDEEINIIFNEFFNRMKKVNRNFK